MAGMKRFVTYIYAYEEEKKGSNVGFARIEIRGQDARIEIHLRGVYAASATCRVYLFQREAAGGKEATGVTGVLVGEMKLANGSGDGAVVLKGGGKIPASSRLPPHENVHSSCRRISPSG